MIEVVPTTLDLVGLPPAEIAQGQSLLSLLKGEHIGGLAPVILDKFQTLCGGSTEVETLRIEDLAP